MNHKIVDSWPHGCVQRGIDVWVGAGGERGGGVERWRGGGNMTVVDERVKAMQTPALMGVPDTSTLSV